MAVHRKKKETLMLQIAGGILLAIVILFIGLPIAFYLIRALLPLWICAGLAFVISSILAIFAHYSHNYNADNVFLIGWPVITIIIGGFWLHCHDLMEKAHKKNSKT